jgi:hypothetical protein
MAWPLPDLDYPWRTSPLVAEMAVQRASYRLASRSYNRRVNFSFSSAGQLINAGEHVACQRAREVSLARARSSAIVCLTVNGSI